MASKSQVIRAAQKINATVLDDGTEIEAFAPKGFVFNATDTVAILVVYRPIHFAALPKSVVWQGMLEDLSAGIRPARDDEPDAMEGWGPIETSRSFVLCQSTTHTIE